MAENVYNGEFELTDYGFDKLVSNLKISDRFIGDNELEESKAHIRLLQSHIEMRLGSIRKCEESVNKSVLGFEKNLNRLLEAFSPHNQLVFPMSDDVMVVRQFLI